jgi:hypothetical protein
LAWRRDEEVVFSGLGCKRKITVRRDFFMGESLIAAMLHNTIKTSPPFLSPGAGRAQSLCWPLNGGERKPLNYAIYEVKNRLERKYLRRSFATFSLKTAPQVFPLIPATPRLFPVPKNHTLHE